MSKQEQIREGLRKMAAKHGPLQTVLATVENRDDEALTCVLDNDDIKLFDVRLRPVINGKESLTLFPKVGSWVLAMRIEDDEDWMIVAADEVDKYRLVIGTLVFEMDAEGYLIQKDEDSLKDALTLIIEATQQIVVMQGNSPNYGKLSKALTKVQNILR